MRSSNHWLALLRWTTAALSLVAANAALADKPNRAEATAPTTWTTWAGDLNGNRNAAGETLLSPATVGGLQPLFKLTTGGDVSATPTVDSAAVYVPDWSGNLFKLDRRSGAVIWQTKIGDYTGDERSWSRTSPAIAGPLLLLADQKGARVIAVDKYSGRKVWVRAVEDHPMIYMTNSPIVIGNTVYVGVASGEEGLLAVPGYKPTFRGSVVALDLLTGKIKWKSYTTPEGYTGAAVWGSPLSADLERGLLYFATGNNYSVPDDVMACIREAADPTAELACMSPQNYVDSIVAMKLDSGEVAWATRLGGADVWNVGCFVDIGEPCQKKVGPDYDFGQGPMLYTTEIDGQPRDLVAAGQKSGMFWALDADTGAVVWSTRVGPASALGGVMWGSATDGERVYVPLANVTNRAFLLGPEFEEVWMAGAWAALDAATGEFIWQVPASGTDPSVKFSGASALGALTVANGVVYAPSMSGDMVALDALTGKTLWKYSVNGSVACGPAVVDGVVYWGTGFDREGQPNNEFFAFGLK